MHTIWIIFLIYSDSTLQFIIIPLTDIENLLSDPHSLTVEMNIRRHAKTEGQNIIQLFFSPSIHTQTKEALQPLLTLYFLCFCLLLPFFFCSPWKILVLILQKCGFDWKLLGLQSLVTQKLLNAPDITSLEDGKIRFQSKEKKFYCLEFF